MNICGGTPECGNLESLEDLLVAYTAHWFCVQLKLPFQQVIYSPNRWFERRCGFDLSVGVVNSKKLLLRIQSKFSATWCDEPQILSLPVKKPVLPPDKPAEQQQKKAQLSKAERLYLQLELLCQSFDCSGGRCYHYMMVQQCYCLHEYRRMGATFDNVIVPDIDSQFRSLAIDLSGEEFRQAFAMATLVRIEVSLRPATKSITCEAVFGGPKRVKLNVKSLPELPEQLKKDS